MKWLIYDSASNFIHAYRDMTFPLKIKWVFLSINTSVLGKKYIYIWHGLPVQRQVFV